MSTAPTHSTPSTLLDVARLAGVSPSTVSRILNGTAKVSDDKRLAVQAAIEKMNGADLDGRTLTVNEAKPKEEMGGGGGGGRNFSSPNRRPGAFQSRY